MTYLSILIPARNEKYLQQTIDDIFEHAEGDIEVLVGLDGYDANLRESPRLRVFREKSRGQRATQNALARQSEAKFLMKLDAHVSLSQGFDVQMLKDMQDNAVLVPALAKLNPETWQVQHKPISSNFYLDTNLVFQYCENR